MTSHPDYYRGRRKEMMPFLPRHYRRVLDIGCGQGTFSAALDRNCERWGIEPDAHAATLAAEQLDRVPLGPYERVAADIPNGHFDLVICNDVIEHMADHEAFLRSIRKKMQPGAYLVGSIPNVRYILNLIDLLAGKDWHYRADGILDRTHLRFFTERSLKRTLSNAGFVIEDLRGINGVKARITPPRRLLQNLLILLFGQDSRHLQFAFRVRTLEGEQ